MNYIQLKQGVIPNSSFSLQTGFSLFLLCLLSVKNLRLLPLEFVNLNSVSYHLLVCTGEVCYFGNPLLGCILLRLFEVLLLKSFKVFHCILLHFEQIHEIMAHLESLVGTIRLIVVLSFFDLVIDLTLHLGLDVCWNNVRSWI